MTVHSEPLTRFGAFVVAKEAKDLIRMPTRSTWRDHETWKEMRDRLKAEWPKLLAEKGRQQVGTGIGKNTPIEQRVEAEPRRPGHELRRLYWYAWTVSTAVPEAIAAKVDPDMLNGYITYETDEDNDD